MKQQQRMRVVRLVNELKSGQHITAEALARKLDDEARAGKNAPAATSRTLRRDLNFLRDELKAPLKFDRRQNTWYFTNSNWEIPYMYLDGEELFAALFSNQVGRYLVPKSLVKSLENANAVELAASASSTLSVHALAHVVVAGTGKVSFQPGTTLILQAWMNRKRLRIEYISGIGKTTPWEIDIHALFLSENVWYARANGGPVPKTPADQKGTVLDPSIAKVVSLPLHRMTEPVVLDHVFERSREIVKGVVDGKFFNYRMVKDVKLHCVPSPEALYISEREWFHGQEITLNKDHSLDMFIPEVSEPQILQWILRFGEGIRVLAPDRLRKKVIEHCERMIADQKAGPAASASV